MPLVAERPNAVPEYLDHLKRRDAMCRKLLLVELQFVVGGIEPGPVNHRDSLSPRTRKCALVPENDPAANPRALLVTASASSDHGSYAFTRRRSAQRESWCVSSDKAVGPASCMGKLASASVRERPAAWILAWVMAPPRSERRVHVPACMG